MKTTTMKVIFLSVVVLVFAFAFQVEIGLAATATDQVTLSTYVNETISLGCGADVNLGTITPGTPVYGATTCTGTTNANAGYDLSVKRDDADTTMDQTTDAAVNIGDRTAWNPSGSGNATVWSSPGDVTLGFSVFASTATKNTTWWGAGTTFNDALNQYAGFPSSYAVIMDHDAYSSGSTATSISYKLDVPSTQESGTYDGTITYQAVSKP